MRARDAVKAAIGAVGAALAAVALAACAPVADSEATLYTDFTLIDGAGGAPLADAAMLVEDGRVRWAGPIGEAPDTRAARQSLGGAFVMPGIVDLHVHLAVVNDSLAMSAANFTRENVEHELNQYAAYGVTSVMTMGTDQALIYDLRRAQRESVPTYARIFTAGQGLVYRGGYGGVPGVNEPVATPEEARQMVARQAEDGADIIKLWVDSELGTMPTMPAAISQAAIEEAHARNLRAVAHIFFQEDASRLVDQGIDGLVHGVRDRPVEPALAARMRERGVWQIAQTLSREATMFAYGDRPAFFDDPFFRAAVSPEVLAQLENPERMRTVASGAHFHEYPGFLDAAKINLRRLAEAGVLIAFGTDSGPPARFPGYSAHWELALMVEAGFTPLEALTAATGHAGQFLGAEIGVLEAGRWADFIVLEADPTADIANTRTVRDVYIAGRRIVRLH